MNASKHMESWDFMEGTAISRICPEDRANILLLVSLMSGEMAVRARNRLSGVPPLLSPSFPCPHRVPEKTEEKVLQYLRGCLAKVEESYHESLMIERAAAVLRDSSRDFAENHHLAQSRRIIDERAVRLAHRDILSWRLWVGPIRQPVAPPSTSTSTRASTSSAPGPDLNGLDWAVWVVELWPGSSSL
jgi:hypothetical protein